MSAAQRNIEITLAWLHRDCSMRDLGVEFYLSTERVSQVIEAMLRRYGLPWEPRMKPDARLRVAAELSARLQRGWSPVTPDTPEHFYHYEQAYRSDPVTLARVHWRNK